MDQLIVDEHSQHFNPKNLNYKEFGSEYTLVRYYASYIAQDAPEGSRDGNLLEQQISEVIKNAVKHGNRCNPKRKVKLWYDFSDSILRLICEDEGPGFIDLEKWNDFNIKRAKCFEEADYENMEKYVAYKTKHSDEEDGGNSLFAAIEYWNGGMIYNSKRNKVVCVRFPDKDHSKKS